MEPLQPNIDAQTLGKAVRQYNVLYTVLISLGILLVLLSCVYIYLRVQSLKGSLHPTDPQQVAYPVVATDETGNVIATMFYNSKDSTQGMWVSYDSGRTFRQVAWPVERDDFYTVDPKNLFIANDEETVIAYSPRTIYIYPRQADSATVIRLFNFPYLANFETDGYFTRANADSIFFYNAFAQICGLRFKQPDSVAVYSIAFPSKKFSSISGVLMDTNRNVTFAAHTVDDNFRAGIYMNGRLDRNASYAIAQYNLLSKQITRPKPDTTNRQQPSPKDSVPPTSSNNTITPAARQVTENANKVTLPRKAQKSGKAAAKSSPASRQPIPNNAGTTPSQMDIPSNKVAPRKDFDPKQQFVDSNKKAD